jgi:CelD/BcsL family acetyltransferase involved in cellulose biosynthesis
MTLDVVTFQHPDEFPADLRRLFDACEVDSTALGCGWYSNYVETISASNSVVRFHALRRDGVAIAAIAVVVRNIKWTLHRAADSLGNYYTTLYAPALAPDVSAAELAKLLLTLKRLHRPLAWLRLQPMDREAKSYGTLLEAMRLARLRAFEFYCFGNWYLRGHVDWPTYLASRPSKMRSNIKRAEKKLLQDGGSIEVIADAQEMERGLQAYERVYASSWKKLEPHPAFIPGLVTAFARRGWLRLGVAWLRGQPIAAQIWFVAHGRAEIFKVAYDESFKDYSPGTALTAKLMEHVMQSEAVHEVDYLIGDDAYKKTWMSDRRERFGVVAYNVWTPAGALWAMGEFTGRLAKASTRRLRALFTDAGRAEPSTMPRVPARLPPEQV